VRPNSRLVTMGDMRKENNRKPVPPVGRALRVYS